MTRPIRSILIVVLILIFLALGWLTRNAVLLRFDSIERKSIAQSFHEADTEEGRLAEEYKRDPLHYHPFNEQLLEQLHPVVAFSVGYLEEDRRRAAQFIEKLLAIPVFDVLAPEKLTDITALSDRRKIIAESLASIDAYEASIQTPQPIIDAILAEHPVPHFYENAVIAARTETYPLHLSELKKPLELERQQLEQLDDFLAFMQVRHGTYALKHGSIVFSSQADVDRYNRFNWEHKELSQRIIDELSKPKVNTEDARQFEAKLRRFEETQ